MGKRVRRIERCIVLIGEVYCREGIYMRYLPALKNSVRYVEKLMR